MLTRDGRDHTQTLWIIGQYIKELLMQDHFCQKMRAWGYRTDSSETSSHEPPCPLTLHCQSKNKQESVAPCPPAPAKGYAKPAVISLMKSLYKVEKTVHHLFQYLPKMIYSCWPLLSFFLAFLPFYFPSPFCLGHPFQK